MDLDWEVGVGMSSVARASAESADVSGAKRFAGCSGATLVLRVMRCDAMRCEGDARCAGTVSAIAVVGILLRKWIQGLE